MVYFSAFAPTQQSPTGADVATISRRDWLYGFTGLCGILYFSGTRGIANADFPVSGPEDWLLRLVDALPADLAALRHQGKSYLAAHPHEADREKLLRLLLPDGRTTSPSPDVVRNVERDWVGHNVTVVNGWVLARTEARLCALIFLLGPVSA